MADFGAVLAKNSVAAVVGSALLAALAGVAVARFGPPPSADVARGTEEAFCEGLHGRELPAGSGPLRWTLPRARATFRALPPGAVEVQARLRGQRTPVAVAADGVVLGLLGPGSGEGRFTVESRGGRLTIDLVTAGFEAGDGRRLGALLERVTVRPAAPSLVADVRAGGVPFAVVAAAVALLALLAGAPAAGAAAAAALVVASEALLLWPAGLLRSPHAWRLTMLLVAGGLGAWAFGRLTERRSAGAGPWAFAALLVAWLVQGAAATTPLMVVSDVLFHAHKLEAVSAGDLFPLSVTQHARPFRFPYGVSFYALLAPLHRAGLDSSQLVRGGAALAAVAASAGLFRLLLPAGAPLAALGVVLWQLLPGVFDLHSFGNLSNVFAQATTVLFLAWWRGPAARWPLGALLLALAALGHLSSAIVLLPVCLALVLAQGRWPCGEEAGRRRVRVLAVAVGLGLAAAYFSRFAPLVLEQLPRLLEGGGQGRGLSRGAAGAMRLQVLGAVTQWGLPALGLALLALSRSRPRLSALDRDLAAYGAGALGCALAAAFSPLDVRYLYALTVVVAAAAARGALWLGARGWAGSLLAGLALLAQAWVGMASLVEAVLYRYR